MLKSCIGLNSQELPLPHYHQNTLFAANQKQSYQELDGRSNILYKAYDGQEASAFRSNN